MRGETHLLQEFFKRHIDFNPLPSCEGRLVSVRNCRQCGRFQSTPLMRGETRRNDKKYRAQLISIHSPHARGDGHVSGLAVFQCAISIHSPHARGDKGAQAAADQSCISIHSPHARGDFFPLLLASIVVISIHSPHARGDAQSCKSFANPDHFNPLPSCEGRQSVGRRGCGQN